VKWILVVVCVLCINHCSFSSARPISKAVIQEQINSSQGSVSLVDGAYRGCEHVPAKGSIKNMWVGFESTGASCSVTVHPDQTVSLSFFGSRAYSVSQIGEQWDILIGFVSDDEVLVVQHLNNRVTGVTHTSFDKDDNLNYGQSGKGDSFRTCHISQKPCD